MFIRNYIIGYGFDLINRSIFYTKIGDFFDNICHEVPSSVYLYDTSKHLLFTTPTIFGLRNNFGQRLVFSVGSKDKRMNK